MLRHEKPRQKSTKGDETLLQKFRQNLTLRTTGLFLEGLFLVATPAIPKIARAQPPIRSEQFQEEKKNAAYFGFVKGITTFQDAKKILESRGYQIFADSVMLVDENKNPLVPFAILCAKYVPYKFIFGDNKFLSETDLLAELASVYHLGASHSPPKNFVITHSVAESDSIYLVSTTVPSGIPLVSVLCIYGNSKNIGKAEELSLGTKEIIDKEGGCIGASAIFQGSTNRLFLYGYGLDGKPWKNVYFWELPNADKIYSIPSSEVGFDKAKPIPPDLLEKELIGKR
ncbi:MAG: hypothetical protein AB1468_00840 [Candidatus Micrarchaeota archaeon]